MVIAFVILLILIWFFADTNKKSKALDRTDWEYLRLLKNLHKMDVWDGVEQQILYKTKKDSGIRSSEYLVRFGHENGAVIRIDLKTVNINRQYWKSGLLADDYAKKYYSELGIRESNEKYQAAPPDIKLYDKDGKCKSYSKFTINTELKNDEEESYRNTINSMLQKTPHKAFTKLTDDINDGLWGIKKDIERIRLLKNGYYPYPIFKFENGRQVSEYLTFEKLRSEITAEYSIYNIKEYKQDISKIDRAEYYLDKSYLTKEQQRVRKTIKDYLWKHYYEQIIAAGADESFKRWYYKF